MYRLLPAPPSPVDPYDFARPPVADGLPWLRVNFVVSADGAVTDEQGRSGGLGGAGDRELFRALRAHADAILVGAGTARAEGYGPHRMDRELAARRAADGREGPAVIVVVTRSLDLDLDAPLFTAARTPTVVLTCAAAPQERRERAAGVARLLLAGQDTVDLAEGLRLLRAEVGATSVVCEGGPELAQDLLDAGLVDELCLTVAPVLVGKGVRLVARLGRRVELDLERIATRDGDLYLGYGVRR